MQYFCMVTNVVKRYKPPSTGDIMYNMINIINTAVHYTGKLLREEILRGLVTRKKHFFFISFISI